MIKKSNKTLEQIKKEQADKAMAENPYDEIRLDDPLQAEKAKAKPKYKGRWERIREKLG